MSTEAPDAGESNIDWHAVIEASLVVIAAASLQISTGFGFSLLAVPVFLTLFSVHVGIQINLVLSLVISLLMARHTRREVDGPLFRHLALGSVLGLPLGIAAFFALPARGIKLTLALAILAVTAVLMTRAKVRRTPLRDAAVGVLSGFFGTSVGVPGPPLLAYLAGAAEEKSLVRGTTLAFYLVVYGAAIVLEAITVGISSRVLVLAGLLLPALAAGVGLGQTVFRRLTPASFRLLQYCILVGTGCYLLYTVLV